VIRAKAVVTVDTIASTLPGRAKTYVGGTPALPDTVVGVGARGGRTDLPVTWDAVPDGAFGEAGVVTLRGTARVVDGGTVSASVRVQVTEPTQTNIASDAAVSATYTESGYSAERLRNGDTADKAWSNWRSGTKNPSDTITFALPAARDLDRVVAHFYRDGSNVSFPAGLKAQVRNASDGGWADAGDEITVGAEGTPVVDVPLRAGAATGVRLVMTARPGGYITMSEVEVYAKAPGVSSDAAASQIEVDGVPVAGFEPGTTDYRVVTADPARAVVTVTPRDPYATVAVERSRGRAVVTVTGEDGSRTTTYRLTLLRR
jgi:hypothetical protein